MADPFNFYALEFNINGGYKRIIRYRYGTIKELKIIRDGGIPQNIWFKVSIQGKLDTFIVKFGESKKHKGYDDLPKIFEFTDNYFTLGG